jgi:hypothetical protein
MNTNTYHYQLNTNAPAGVFPAYMVWTDNKAQAKAWAKQARRMGYPVAVTRFPAGDYTVKNARPVFRATLALTTTR